MTEQTQWTLRLPADALAALKDAHAESYPKHRLSFNAWMLAVIEQGSKSAKWDVPKREE